MAERPQPKVSAVSSLSPNRHVFPRKGETVDIGPSEAFVGPSADAGQAWDSSLLIHALRQAAELEHCLMNTYLYAACSIATHPDEFASLDIGRKNNRRAIHFERAREWKRTLLEVAREEMLHLHYVQCMLRALGESPHFRLPKRSYDGCGWHVPAWSVLANPADGKSGTDVPLETFGREALQRFVMYESSVALQRTRPFGPGMEALYKRLADGELNVKIETVVSAVKDGAQRRKLRRRLHRLYSDLLPSREQPVELQYMLALRLEPEPPPLMRIQFDSIGELYDLILREYVLAARAGRVVATNHDLNKELQDAQEALLPLRPVNRDRNFEERNRKNQSADYQELVPVKQIIDEIVESGEGRRSFTRAAKRLADEMGQLKFVQNYAVELARISLSNGPERPESKDFEARQRLRLSHLYRFAVAFAEYENEEALHKEARARSRLNVVRRHVLFHDPKLKQMAAEVPQYFNASYLVLLSWLERLYAPAATWQRDTPRRVSIEALATWPLMSMAIRPLLELDGFFDNSSSGRLFRCSQNELPTDPAFQELAGLFAAGLRSGRDYDRRDELAQEALKRIADWATAFAELLVAEAESDKREPRQGVRIEIGTPELQQIQGRLEALKRLAEFEKQFAYRTAGGYSGAMPVQSLTPDQLKGAETFEERATHVDFGGRPLLRLRFAGRALVQLATDPDPPTDDAGCSGTHMLHASDVSRETEDILQKPARMLDRRLVWQPRPDWHVLRDPLAKSIELGVRVTQAHLLRIEEKSQLATSTTVLPLNKLGKKAILEVDLADRDGRHPYLFGDNHIVWQDGEPIDPFQLEIRLRDGRGRVATLLRRSVFDRDLPMTRMNPVQRAMTSRAPSGPDQWRQPGAIPDWAQAVLEPETRAILSSVDFNTRYLSRRKDLLLAELITSMDGDPLTFEQFRVDTVVSLFERLQRVLRPRNTTQTWLKLVVPYRHSLSGEAGADGIDRILALANRRTWPNLKLGKPTREPRGRWLVDYCLGLMDTDNLSYFVYGELVIPLDEAAP